MVILQRERSCLHSHRKISYAWQQVPCTWGFHHTILRLKQKLQRTSSLYMGKSLRFTIPNSKINDKSKSSWWSIHSAPKSFLCIRFSKSRILTLGHPHKRCRISLVHERSSDNPLVLQAERNIYRIFTTLRFSYAPKKTFCWSIIASSINHIHFIINPLLHP